MEVEPANAGLWAKARAAAHDQIVEIALDLFFEDGFDGTTIDQIVATAAISRRSFFRYFGTKEDVVLGDTKTQGHLFADALRARPTEEDPWTALHRAAAALPASRYSEERAFAIARLIVNTPSLIARHAVKQVEWQQQLVPVIQERMGLPAHPADVRALAIVSSALACLDAATEAWVANDRSYSLDELYTQAITAVRT